MIAKIISEEINRKNKYNLKLLNLNFNLIFPRASLNLLNEIKSDSLHKTFGECKRSL